MKNIRFLRIAFLIAIVSVILGLAGCASPANRETMSLPSFNTTKKFNKTVSVLVSGGSDTGAMESTNISDEEFKASIEDAINKSKIFSEITKDSNSDLDLQVSIASLSKPSFGFTFEVSMEAGWILSRRSDKSVLMKKSVKSTGKATTSDALIAVNRIQMAVERAAQNNISQGLNAIAELNIK
ncbi:hypothetical protein ICN18_06090 [Polynucleobacter sp. Ross1-W9]|uniref:hypothetical protein n=1 Tax=Polynucleobacter parvulilacunae TaxID=1855631 RepID=UPI001C0BCC78|nr:hypothetical protein [Polynucleobacter parvulilacunae]MBU3557196.1 hypothetical protein [Polynucleobacter parvulilacunae]